MSASPSVGLVVVITTALIGVAVGEQYPFNNITLPISTRVKDLVSRLTLKEKAAQLQNGAPAIEHLGVPAFQYWNEGIHGLLEWSDTGSTVFPIPLALGATFDHKLLNEIAAMISDEGRAYDNRERNTTGNRRAINFWAPNINLFRDPRWGRGLEVYTEDPTLMARMAVAYVKGIQGNHPNYTKANASPKHFAAYSLEGAEGFNRHDFDAQVPVSQLEGIYFKAFKAAFVEGKAKSSMCSYNSVNGVPACANKLLLTTYLRQAWNFTGFVVSDCGAITDIDDTHHYVDSHAKAEAASIKAGCELACDGTWNDIPEAVEKGYLTEADVDTALSRVFTSRFELGTFDPPEMVPWSSLGMEVVGSPAHIAKAREAAAKSFVLLKNDGILPLKASELKKVGVAGPLSDWSEVLLGNYYGRPAGPVKTPKEVLQEWLGAEKVEANQVIPYVLGSPTEWITGGYNMARDCDVTLLFMGSSAIFRSADGGFIIPYMEGEGYDKNSLKLPPAQDGLIKAAARAGKPVVLVMMHGGAFDLSPYKDLPNIKAILIGWLPGMGSEALGDVLFGDISPSGRLPITMYYNNYTTIQPMSNMDWVVWPGRSYMYVKVPVVYEFGAGLSYSRFLYRDLVVEQQADSQDPLATSFAFTLHNEGPMDADEVVLFFWSRDGVVRNDVEELPQKMLLDFQRVHLKVGESARLLFQFGAHLLADSMLAATKLTDARPQAPSAFPATFHIGPLRHTIDSRAPVLRLQTRRERAQSRQTNVIL